MTLQRQTSSADTQYAVSDAKLNVIASMCATRIDRLLGKLDVNLEISGRRYTGNCPIHGESDSNCFYLYYEQDYNVPNYWKCPTRACDSKFKPTIIGFTRGCLSNKHLNYHWKKNPKAVFGFKDTVNYLCDFLGKKYRDIRVDPEEEEKRRFIIECNRASRPDVKVNGKVITRAAVRKNLIIPSEYFMKRGYSEAILDKYDVGTAIIPRLDNSDRVIVPIYNEGAILIGYTCRSIFERCLKCRCFHSPERACPRTDLEKNSASKWKNINFSPSEHLYNYYNARAAIATSHTAILVEGPGDVWRLVENGIENVVGLFGNTMYEAQSRLLLQAQCMNVIVLTDSDEAGVAGAQLIKNKYSRYYRLFFPKISEKDAGDLNGDVITDKIKPIIDAAASLI